jgi:hypothetical protein
MATERQIAANRRNACNSTGPRSSAAKRRTSQNAYRHGLAARHNPGPATAKQLDQLARQIAGDSDSVIVLELARSAAQAEFDLARVRRSKVALIQQVSAFGVVPLTSDPSLDELRKTSARFKHLKTMPAQEPERTADAVRPALSELVKLSRYETRAVSRRDRAIREIAKIRSRRDRLT